MTRYLSALLVAYACLGVIESARAQAPVPGQPYQVPDGYTGYGSGTLISYGGYNYVIQGDGTMLLAADQGGASQDANQPVADQPYQVPVEFANSDAGTMINYGGADYVAQGDGTMLLQQPSGFVPSMNAGDAGISPDISQPGFTYGSYYGPPAGGVDADGAGLASANSTSLSLGIGVIGNTGWNRNPWTSPANRPGVGTRNPAVSGRPNMPYVNSGRPASGQVIRPGGQVNRPGGYVNRPGGQVFRPGGQVSRPGGQVFRPGGQVFRPGGQVFRPGGQVFRPGGQPSYARGNSFRPSGGGFAGARPMRRR